ncbi:hypothetical protein QJQ45_007723 [Haematococcus lacustris]|nr:hypothetical protein QJQ45_007723 [Haematococcus lacustris]
MLRHYILPTQVDWPRHLAFAEFAINNSWQESIQSTPFLVNYGQSPITPMLHKLPRPCLTPSAESFAKKWEHEVKHAQECMRVAQDRQERYENKRRRDVTFSVGDSVLLSTKNLRNAPGKARKFLPRYVGPFKVTGRLAQELGPSTGLGTRLGTVRVGSCELQGSQPPRWLDTAARAPPRPSPDDRRARREERQRVAQCRSRRGNTQPATQPARGGPSRRRYGIPSSGSSSEEWEARRAGHQQAGRQRVEQLGHGSPHVRRYGLLSPSPSLASSLGASCDSPVVESAGPREGRLKVPKRQQPEQAAQLGEEVEQLGPLPLRPPLAIYSREPRVCLRRPGAKLACIEATPPPPPRPSSFARSASPSQLTHPPPHTRSPRGGKPGLAMQRPGVAARFLAVTLNVQGLAHPHKLQALLDWAADSPAQVVFLQECHRADSVWHSQGCLLLVKPSTILQGCTQVQLQAEGAQGRVLRVDGELAGRPVSLVYVHAPAQQAERPTFYAECLPACLPPAADRILLLMGGDFNCILAPVDRVGIPQGSQHGEARVGSQGQGTEQLQQLVGERGLVDPWRHLHPSKRDLTHFSKRWQTGARLDRWYISEELVQWHMDSAIQGVLPDFLKAEALHHEAASQLGLPRDGHRARWARIKQGMAMRAQHFLRAQRRAQRDLQQRREKAAAVARARLVRQLVRVEREGEAEVQAAQHLGEAAALAGVGAREQGAQQSLLASAVLDQYYGDRSSFYFYHRDQPAHTPTLISSLQLPGQPGQPEDLTTPSGVKAACRAFQQHYSAAKPTGVYAAKPVDTVARATLLGSLTFHLTPTQARQGCAHSKAPGLDGLPMEVYDRLWVELGRPLRAMLQEALADTADPTPLAEFLTGIITLVPKASKPSLSPTACWQTPPTASAPRGCKLTWRHKLSSSCSVVADGALRELELKWEASAQQVAGQGAAGEREQQGKDVEERLPEEVQGSQPPRWLDTSDRAHQRPSPQMRAAQQAERQLEAQQRRGGRQLAAQPAPRADTVDQLAVGDQAGQPCAKPHGGAMLLLSGRPTRGEDPPFQPPDSLLWLRLRVAYLGAVWRLRSSGAATALQPQQVARRVVEEIISTLTTAVKRDWHRVGRDIRVCLCGAVPSTWFKGKDPELDAAHFDQLWPEASGG